jgi:hypothetical protein
VKIPKLSTPRSDKKPRERGYLAVSEEQNTTRK